MDYPYESMLTENYIKFREKISIVSPSKSALTNENKQSRKKHQMLENDSISSRWWCAIWPIALQACMCWTSKAFEEAISVISACLHVHAMGMIFFLFVWIQTRKPTRVLLIINRTIRPITHTIKMKLPGVNAVFYAWSLDVWAHTMYKYVMYWCSEHYSGWPARHFLHSPLLLSNYSTFCGNAQTLMYAYDDIP